ncbi:MAG: phospholipase D family protein [Halioglobus sp.]|nr:phospholipase D active site domain protein [marine gamma proteobacterium HTCC2148]MDG2327855.1 phospholipase D family protein [Halioglobus sp.]
MHFSSFVVHCGRSMKVALLAVTLFITLLSACSSPVKRAVLEEELALLPSQDEFWQQIVHSAEDERFHLLNAGDEASRWRLLAIDSARRSIDLESFLWLPDETGNQILAHLVAAGDRGVRVRILLDDSFTPHQDLALHHLDLHPNIELRLYNPYSNRPASLVGRTIFNLGDFARVNHRMHNKALVVDSQAAIVGGRNMADEYFGFHGDYNFRDMEVLTTGNSVAAVSTHFDNFWNSGWSFPVGQIVDAPSDDVELKAIRVYIADNTEEFDVLEDQQLLAAWRAAMDNGLKGKAIFFSDQPATNDPAADSDQPSQLASFLRQTIAEAQTDIIAVTAYFVPTPELLAEMEKVVKRGVRVRVLTNSMRSNNHLAAHAAYQGYLRGLLGAGVEIFETRADAQDRDLYMQAPSKQKKLGLHAKFMIIDQDKAVVGSSNLDPRSLKLNTEIGLMIHSQELNTRLRELTEVDFLPENSWSVQIKEGELVWVGDDQTLRHPPADSKFQQLEDWFIGLLPIDSQM